MTRYTQGEFDGGRGATTLVQRVVRAVAAELDADPVEMEPLYGAIDPEGLNALFAPTYGGSERSEGEVTFRYAGCTVTAHANGDVDVASRAESDALDPCRVG